MLDLVLAQPLIGAAHITDNNGDVLEPPIVAARVCRNWPSLGRKIFGQLDEFVSQPHAHHAHAEAKDALKMLIGIASHFDV